MSEPAGTTESNGDAVEDTVGVSTPNPTGPSRNSRRWMLILVGLLPVVIWVGREAVAGTTIGFMRTVDMLDILVVAPILAAVMLYLWFYMQDHDAPRRLAVAFIAFVIAFMYGHGLHAAANAIHTFATEVNDYKDQMPPDLYILIYDMDERFSHWVMFVAVTGLLATWLYFDRLELARPILPRKTWLIGLLGAVYGVVLAYGVIEARTVWLIVPMLAVLVGEWLVLWRRTDLGFRAYLLSRPFTTFVAFVSVAAVIATLAWGAYFGGFPQPSEVYF